MPLQYHDSDVLPLIELIATMGWLRFVGTLKLQVSIGEYTLFYRALLQKRPIILIVATPYEQSIVDRTCWQYSTMSD